MVQAPEETGTVTTPATLMKSLDPGATRSRLKSPPLIVKVDDIVNVPTEPEPVAPGLMWAMLAPLFTGSATAPPIVPLPARVGLPGMVVLSSVNALAATVDPVIESVPF